MSPPGACWRGCGGEKIIRVRSYIRRAKAESTPDGQEKWEV